MAARVGHGVRRLKTKANDVSTHLSLGGLVSSRGALCSVEASRGGVLSPGGGAKPTQQRRHFAMSPDFNVLVLMRNLQRRNSMRWILQ